MNNEEQQKQQDFLNEFSNYQYIREDGHLVLEKFSVYLSYCFECDGIIEVSPTPLDIYGLLIVIIQERLGNNDAERYIQHQNILDWTPDKANIYPNKTMTCIHVAALTKISHEWIHAIGYDCMQIPEPYEGCKYFYWAKEEWVTVHAFINGYHNALASLQKEVDRKHIQNNGYSSFEALHLSYDQDISFDVAVNILKARHDSYQMALTQIKKAIDDGYFLEAIVLEENIINNCIYNYLVNTGEVLDNPSFSKMLRIMRDREKNNFRLSNEWPSGLFKSLDSWRKARNKSVHGFIKATSNTLSQSKKSFLSSSVKTSKEGEVLCDTIVSWYEQECVNFINHEWPSTVVAH